MAKEQQNIVSTPGVPGRLQPVFALLPGLNEAWADPLMEDRKAVRLVQVIKQALWGIFAFDLVLPLILWYASRPEAGPGTVVAYIFFGLLLSSGGPGIFQGITTAKGRKTQFLDILWAHRGAREQRLEFLRDTPIDAARFRKLILVESLLQQDAAYIVWMVSMLLWLVLGVALIHPAQGIHSLIVVAAAQALLLWRLRPGVLLLGCITDLRIAEARLVRLAAWQHHAGIIEQGEPESSASNPGGDEVLPLMTLIAAIVPKELYIWLILLLAAVIAMIWLELKRRAGWESSITTLNEVSASFDATWQSGIAAGADE